MSNIFTNLPVPAGANGSGAAVDTSGCGAAKFVIIDGEWTLPDRPPTVTIEINNDVTPSGTWAPLGAFIGNGKRLIQCAARWMRCTVTGYRGGTNPLVNFGSTDDPASFVTPAVPAGNGVGAATDITALPEWKTLTIGDAFLGQVVLEYSEDAGGVDWAELLPMSAPGQMSFPLVANWIRVRRQGIPSTGTPGTPIVNLGGVAPSAGSGSGDGVDVQLDETPIVTPATTLDFVGGVAIAESPPGTAQITIGVDAYQDAAPVILPATDIDAVSSEVAPLGLDLADEGSAVLSMEVTLGARATHNASGGEPADIDITGWIVALVNDGPDVEVNADFVLPSPDALFLEVTLLARSATNLPVSVFVPDLAEAPDTFVSVARGDTITFVSYEGAWYLKSQNGFTG